MLFSLALVTAAAFNPVLVAVVVNEESSCYKLGCKAALAFVIVSCVTVIYGYKLMSLNVFLVAAFALEPVSVFVTVRCKSMIFDY